MDENIDNIPEETTRLLANVSITNLFGRVDRLEQKVNELATPLERYTKGWVITLFSIGITCFIGLTGLGAYYLYNISHDIGSTKTKIEHLDSARKSDDDFKRTHIKKMEEMERRLLNLSQDFQTTPPTMGK